MQSQRQVDQNGYVTILRNPISRTGVFQYSGRGLPGADPDKIYNVLRPEEELAHPEAIASFKMIPLINDHVMLGDGFDTKAEEKGVHGATGEDVVFENGILYSSLRIFSDALKGLIDSGKKALSMGYRCAYEKTSGVFQGQGYDYIQRNIRGNHIALVQEGRMGPDIAVLDSSSAFDHFDLALNKGEDEMTDEEKAEAAAKKKAEDEAAAAEGAEAGEVKDDGEGEKEMTLAEASAAIKKILPVLEEINAAVSAMKGAGGAANESGVLDEDEEKAKKEKEGMDAAINARLTAVEQRSTKDVLAEVAARDALVKELTPAVGTFDHSLMTADDVAVYGVEKLGIKAPKGQERAALDGFLAGRKAAAASGAVGFGMDTKPKADGKLATSLQSRQ